MTNNTLLNLKRSQLNRLVQVLKGHCNLQVVLSLLCSLQYETPNHHTGNCKLHQGIRVTYFRIIKTSVHDVVTKCNINKLARYLKEAGRVSEFDQ